MVMVIQMAGEQGEVLNQKHIPQSPGHTQAAALGHSSHRQAGHEGDRPEGVHGARAGFRKFQQLGGQKEQPQQKDHHAGKDKPLTGLDGVGPAQGKSLFQKKYPRQDARQKAEKPGHGGQVAAAQTDDHAQGAAQEDQRANHDEQPQDETGGGGGACPALELMEGQGGHHGAQHDADDLGAHVLHRRGAVEAQSSSDVPLEAGDTEAHIFGVAHGGEQQGRGPHHHAGEDNQSIPAQKAIFLHKTVPTPFLVSHKSREQRAGATGSAYGSPPSPPPPLKAAAPGRGAAREGRTRPDRSRR